MPYAKFTFTVIGRRVVAPSNVQAAVADVGYSRLVLSACTPLFSAAKRLLVYARLTRTVPVGAAGTLAGGGLAQPIETPRPPQAAGAGPSTGLSYTAVPIPSDRTRNCFGDPFSCC